MKKKIRQGREEAILYEKRWAAKPAPCHAERRTRGHTVLGVCPVETPALERRSLF